MTRDNVIIDGKIEIHFENSYCIIKYMPTQSYVRISGNKYENILSLLNSSQDLDVVLKKIYALKGEDKANSTRLQIRKRINEKNLASRFHKYLPNSFFSPKVVIFSIVLGILIGCIVLMNHESYGRVNLAYSLIWITINIVLHESGHFYFCLHAGRSVSEIGIKLNLSVFPACYVNTTDICMANKKERILTSLGGIYLNAILCILTSSILLFTRPNNTIYRFVLISFSFIISNSLPFIKLDGYYILSDILCISKLSEQAKKTSVAILIRRKKIAKDNCFLLLYFIMERAFIIVLLFCSLYYIFQKLF